MQETIDVERFGSFQENDEVGSALVEHYWSVEDQPDFH